MTLALFTQLNSNLRKATIAKTMLVIAGVAVAGVVYAAATGGTTPASTSGTVITSMNGILTLITDIVTGPLGKILAIVCLIAGAAAGAIKRDFVWLLIGAFMALALGYGPSFIDSLFTAAI